MDQIYITDIKIDHVRHLKNIEIPLSENHMKHLIITGKNGSGKTSLLDALARYIYLISVCSLSNLFFRFHTTTLTEACSNELKQHHL